MLHKDTPKEEALKLAPACRCTKCEHGCKYGSGAFAKGEEEQAAKALGMTAERFRKEYLEEIEKFNTRLWRPRIEREKDRPYGRCVFFDVKKGCTIHAVKPLECKTSAGCSPKGEELSAWFTINHFLNPHDPESIRQYAAYLNNGGKALPGAALHDVVKDAALLQKILGFEIVR